MKVAGTGRIRDLEVPPHVLRAWELVIAASQVLTAACLESCKEAQNGEALWGILRKGIADVYGRVPGKTKYVPFVSELVKELPEGAPVVDALLHLPLQVANDLQSPKTLLRELTPSEQAEFKDLVRKYDRLGGEQSQWHEYHAREDIDGLGSYDLEEKMMCPAACMAVGRAKDEFIRKILACCRANFLLISIAMLYADNPDLQDMGMLAGSLLKRVFCPKDTIRWSGLDETQAFTAVKLPRWLWYLQAGPRLPLAAVPQKHRKAEWTEDTLIRPFYTRMAMGQSWSVFILMLIHPNATSRLIKMDPPLETFKLLNLR